MSSLVTAYDQVRRSARASPQVRTRSPTHVCSAPLTRQEVTLEMSTKQGPAHVVVDGSNIATEGRSMPSLAQLSEAVGGFMEEHPDTAITVVVDATFGHRIDKREVPEFEAGISNNELVAPPAGAVGRGDAFVLGIADKAGASVLSNDSFQEFHGEYTWLFDEGRLIGGKPVPHVGWVWVERVPVRGPISRKATRGAGGGGSRRSSGGRSRRGSSRDESTVRTGSKEASGPMPTPKSPPPGRGSAKSDGDSSAPKRSPKRAAKGSSESSSGTAKSAPKGGDPVNELMPFLDFVEHHPIGTSVNGTVDAYSSHGAYITIGDSEVRGYVPLRLMADPAPRSAKSVMKVGESVTVVVVSFAPARRSIDCAVPDLAAAAIAAAASQADEAEELAPVRRRSRRPRGPRQEGRGEEDRRQEDGSQEDRGEEDSSEEDGSQEVGCEEGARRRRAAAKKTAAKKTAAKKPAAKKTAAKKSTAKKRRPRSAAKKRRGEEERSEEERRRRRPAAKKTAAKKPAAKKPAKKTRAANESGSS